LGPLELRQEQVYNIVLEAQTAGLGKIKPGVKASEVDGAVRSVFEKYGYLDNFRHSTGHGVGLTVHENPRLSIKDETILAEGMVLTVEPGIYFPGWGGVRIEDMVVVEKKGCRRLTGAPRDQLIVCNSGCIIQ
jgi:Xaa-Pro aminopeptidase/Xaa-Pro dipeptidase